MKNMRKISVIIAAYNAEKFLSETLDSIFLQTMDCSEYEVIVINDGSSDTTLDILNSYKEHYSNLIIIDKENGGPSSARNTGLDIARGEYIFFFDADDILESDALSSMYNTASSRNADLLIGKYDIFNHHTTIEVHTLDTLVTLEEIDKYNIDILWTFALWNKLFRRSLIEKYNLRFAPVSYSEDGVFVLEYLYHCNKVTGLDQIITHYRRFNNAGSITSFISPAKFSDYITAHQMMFSSAQESFLRDYPEYTSIEDARKQNPDIHNYLNTIIQKELQIILNQFYIQLWKLDSSTIKILVSEIQNLLQTLDVRTLSLLSSSFPEFSLYDIKSTKEEVLESSLFTAVLYGDSTSTENFLKTLESLENQNLIFIKIVVPYHMKKDVEKAGLIQDNIFFKDCTSKENLFTMCLQQADTPYITFCDTKITYGVNAFRLAFRHFLYQYDFIVEGIYHKKYSEAQPLLLSRISATSLKAEKSDNPCLTMDATLANKFFRTDFIKNLALDFNISLPDFVRRCYCKGNYNYLLAGTLFYNDKPETFIDYIATDDTHPFIEEYLKDKPITLDSADILYNPGESGMKFCPLSDETDEEQEWNKKALAFQKKPLKDQVLFISVRADGKLEGNAKALYPFIKGKKIICASRLPHDSETALKMTEALLTSKVIVTDDYVKYLRYFPLRPQQRVIQLWHACGAFKKFGQRGTNLPLPVDRATHAQYNLVCVSGEEVRSIYADALDVNYNKVKALGCPRTDEYFNKRLINKTKRKIYFHHPSLIGKSIIVYAPTFRDVGCDRSEFHPELDFDRLSKELLPNQVLLICPHPIMKNDILPHKYKNIHVMRDFSTNDYMLLSDMLITDYSSVIFEYALLRKPIAFFCYDLETYDRGFYLNYPDDLPGNIYTTQDELTLYLTHPEEHRITDKMNDFISKYMSACDGHSCERIASLINSYMEEK